MVRATLVGIALVLLGCSGDVEADRGSGATEPPGALQAATVDMEADEGVRDAVTVIGVGRVSGRPDVMRATIGVEVAADSVEDALGTANERAAQVISALEDAGIATEDIQSQDLSVRDRRPPPRPEVGGEQPAETSEILATNVVEVRIRELDRAGQVLQAASDAGGDATRIRGVRFELEDDGSLLADARERAFDDARDKAEQYADLAGRELGELVMLQEHPRTGSPLPGPLAEEAQAADTAVPVEPGTQELTVRVAAVWSFG